MMNNKILTLITFVLWTTSIIAQSTFPGINYQAVARDLNGAPLPNQDLSIKITLLANPDNPTSAYTETHQVKTNELGLFTLVVGQGKQENGTFQSIPWATSEIWMDLSIDEKGRQDYKKISSQQLLAVPYAIHALTANRLSGERIIETLRGDPGVPSNTWSTLGNAKTKEGKDFLGTTDCADLVMITDNQERLRITCEGDIGIESDFSTGNDLYVYNNVYLNVTGGNTIINGPTTVANMSPTHLTGSLDVDKTLNVDGISTLNDDLTVTNMAATHLTGSLDVDKTLNVDGTSTLNDDLTVTNMAPTHLTGSLDVDKSLNVDDNTTLNKDLQVEGNSSFKGKTVFDIEVDGLQTEQSSYPVLIKGSKQGLAIDLVPATNNSLKSHRGNNYISFWRDGVQKGRIEGMGRADLDPTGMVNLFTSIIQNPPTAFTNQGLDYNPFGNLQFGTPPSLEDLIMVDIGEFPSLTGGDIGAAPRLTFGCPVRPATCDDGGNLGWSWNDGTLPTLPTLSGGRLPNVQFGEIEDWIGFIPFNDITNEANYSGYLNIVNGFANVEANPVSPAGTVWSVIKAGLQNLYPSNQEDATNFESQIFSNYTLDVLTSGISAVKELFSFVTSLSSILDPGDILTEATDLIVEVTNLIIYGGYADINLGVAYESGSGDYAEWLEREYPEEFISPGDVVGVIGGKISKTFTDADKFMVVSTAPLLLGNMPENKVEEANSEKIAFMGQVPVKVQGKVNIGDYILPSGCGDGLAIAVSPDKMLARDYQRIVGIAWTTSDDNQFVSLVNTAIGINQNDMARVVESMQVTLNNIQTSLAKLDPEFTAHHYEVEGEIVVSNTDMTTSPLAKSNFDKYFGGKTYTSKKEVLTDVRRVLKEESNIDLRQYPLIDYIFENPDKATEIANIYRPIVEDMEITQKEIMANRK